MTTVQIAPTEFRDMLGNWPTGVVVVTGGDEENPIGMSCNSFTSVSLDPPLVGFFPAKSSSTWPDIRRTGKFCVNILASHHEAVSRQFARKGEDRFNGVAWEMRPSGPGLDEAVAWIECEINEEINTGDHTLVLGLVTGFAVREGAEPLIFHRGAYSPLRGETV